MEKIKKGLNKDNQMKENVQKRDTFKKDNKKEKTKKNKCSRKRTKNENVQETEELTQKRKQFFWSKAQRKDKHAQNLQICENVQKGKKILETCRSLRNSF